MTINPTEYSTNGLEEPPLTPTNDGTVQFLGADVVKYISPPRVEAQRQRIRPTAPAPPPTVPYSSVPPAPQQLVQSPPPPYQSPMYPPVMPVAPPPPQPAMIPVSMPLMSHQYMAPQMAPMVAPMVAPQPQMVYMPTVQQNPYMAPMAHQMVSPPQVIQAQPQQQSSPAITLCINQSPQSLQSAGSPGGTVGALVCPKCRKGVITRKQDRFRKRILMCLGICLCPLTCCIPIICLCCNYVDTCGACRKSYGHRGRKNYKKKVNAVKL